MNEILELLQKNATLTAAQIAVMLNKDEAAVAAEIKKYEESKVIVGYNAMVDWDKISKGKVRAYIEVTTSPQTGMGYDKIAQYIANFPEVESVYLLSGTYDLAVIIPGDSLQDVAKFVSDHLAPIDGVVSTVTHFILKRYKDNYCQFSVPEEQEERILFV